MRDGRHRHRHGQLSRLLGTARQAKGSGVNFAFIKLNQGTGYVNPYATCQVNAARANGIREGAYDFASPQTSSPEAEADKFVAEARARGMVGPRHPSARLGAFRSRRILGQADMVGFALGQPRQGHMGRQPDDLHERGHDSDRRLVGRSGHERRTVGRGLSARLCR